ncbi:MAG: hypothetical protein ACOYB2_10875 [Limnohabitans sp.]
MFGVDRDPLAAATWRQRDPGFEDDDGSWFCEIHGDDREACLRFEADQDRMERESDALADAMLGGLT